MTATASSARRRCAQLETAGRPLPLDRGAAKHVEIYRARGVVLLVEGGHAVRAIHTSTGDRRRQPGPRHAAGEVQDLPQGRALLVGPYKSWLPYAAYWVGGWALHGYADVPASPASHGCARLPLPEAKIVYDFVDDRDAGSGHLSVQSMEASEPRRRRPAIVAVDDEPAVLAAVARDLRRQFGERYRIVRATSGAEALGALARSSSRAASRSRCWSPTSACPGCPAPSTWSRRASSCRTPSACC